MVFKLYFLDHFSDNVGELLEAYVKNKTTPSNFEWIMEKLIDSQLGYLVGGGLPKDKICQYCPVVYDLFALERKLGMSSIQLTGEISYICSVLKIENLDICIGVIEPNMVSIVSKENSNTYENVL